MNLKWKRLVSKKTIANLSRFIGRSLSPYPNVSENRFICTFGAPIPTATYHASSHYITLPQNLKCPKPNMPFYGYVRSTQQARRSHSGSEPKLPSDEEDDTVNEFLSRFVWIMRGKLSEAYPSCDKETINGMLLIIVGKVVSEMDKGSLEHMLTAAEAVPSQDLSQDLWTTVWEVSNSVLEDMEKARKKETMKNFLQSEEVKEMSGFAEEVGIRGDMLRELRFKWAREKMEENEFYESLERLREEERAEGNKEDLELPTAETMSEEVAVADEKPKVVSLPKRHGKIKYKIYGLDLSDPKWAEVADKIHQQGEFIWPQEPKPITGKCKLVMEKILSLKENNNPSPLVAEWVELLQPSRIDWISLLDRLKEQNSSLYFKVAELVLRERSFQTNIHDYSKLIDAHANENRLEDVERILKMMSEDGMAPDILTATILVHMYSKAGNLDRAREAFENLKGRGFLPDIKIYYSMIMAYVKSGQPDLAESLMREMETRGIKPTDEIFMALLRSFAQLGNVGGATRIASRMQLSGFQPSLESCKLLVEAHALAGLPEEARNNFDYMIKLGHKPDDRCTASMIAAYEKKNLFDKALKLLLQLEKDGFEPGPATYTVLLDWMSRLQLLDEAEHLLGKIVEQGEAPPLKIQVSLCDMYSRAGVEKKALQALGVLEGNKGKLGPDEFERIIGALAAGGFVQDAQRVHEMMEAQGFTASENLKVSLMSSQAFNPSQIFTFKK